MCVKTKSDPNFNQAVMGKISIKNNAPNFTYSQKVYLKKITLEFFKPNVSTP